LTSMEFRDPLRRLVNPQASEARGAALLDLVGYCVDVFCPGLRCGCAKVGWFHLTYAPLRTAV
jgi:hypothetical protein